MNAVNNLKDKKNEIKEINEICNKSKEEIEKLKTKLQKK